MRFARHRDRRPRALRRGARSLESALAAVGLAWCSMAPTFAPAEDAVATSPGTRREPSDFRVCLLGTGIPVPNPERAAASTLVVAGDQVLLFDTGRGFLANFTEAGKRDADAVFYTHFHSDHFAELNDLLVLRTIFGATEPLPAYGPAGAERVLGGLVAAFAQDLEFRVAHHGEKYAEAGTRVAVHESGPGVVFEKEGVKVTMFEVDHAPVAPAVGYRIDYDGRSVVISGDTKRCDRLVEMAADCDLLVHEAVNERMARTQMAAIGPAGRLGRMMEEMLQYHTPTLQVAEIARDAGAKALALTHLVPSIAPADGPERMFMAGMTEIYAGPISCGRDGMWFEVR